MILLESDRLLLKEISIQDLNPIHKLHSIPEVDEFNTLGIPKDLQETEKFILSIIEDQNSKQRKQYCWGVWAINSNDFIGLAGLVVAVERFKMAEIYFKLSPDFWGKGYATEISNKLLKFGFEELRLHRIEAGVATENIKSIRVLEKVGMTREGLRRKILPIRGEWKDNYHYAILENEYLEIN